MNQLTWVIYLSEVIPQLSVIFGLAALPIVAIYIIKTICIASYNDCRSDSSKEPYKNPTWYIVWVVILLVVSSLLPGRQTILLMAGSQFGQQIVETPQAKQLLDGIQDVIKSQLESYTKKETK